MADIAFRKLLAVKMINDEIVQRIQNETTFTDARYRILPDQSKTLHYCVEQINQELEVSSFLVSWDVNINLTPNGSDIDLTCKNFKDCVRLNSEMLVEANKNSHNPKHLQIALQNYEMLQICLGEIDAKLQEISKSDEIHEHVNKINASIAAMSTHKEVHIPKHVKTIVIPAGFWKWGTGNQEIWKAMIWLDADGTVWGSEKNSHGLTRTYSGSWKDGLINMVVTYDEQTKSLWHGTYTGSEAKFEVMQKSVSETLGKSQHWKVGLKGNAGGTFYEFTHSDT